MLDGGAVVVHCGVVPTWWLPPTHLAGVALARNLCEIPKRQWVRRFIASPQPPDRLCCLPDELLLLVAEWLDVRELLALTLVNHQWRSLLADPQPWKKALLTRRRVTKLTRADERCLKSYLGLALTDAIPWRRLAVEEYLTPSSWEKVLEACGQLCALYGIAPESAVVTTTQSLAAQHDTPPPNEPRKHRGEPGSTALSDIVEQLMHNAEASNSLCIVVLQRRDLIPTAYGLPSWYRRVRVFYLPDADPSSFYSIRLSSP